MVPPPSQWFMSFQTLLLFTPKHSVTEPCWTASFIFPLFFYFWLWKLPNIQKIKINVLGWWICLLFDGADGFMGMYTESLLIKLCILYLKVQFILYHLYLKMFKNKKEKELGNHLVIPDEASCSGINHQWMLKQLNIRKTGNFLSGYNHQNFLINITRNDTTRNNVS